MALVLPDAVEMIEKGAPHIIHNDEELDAYTEQLFALTLIEEPTPAQVEAIDLLGLLIQTYEAKVYPIPPATPVEVLRHLMDSHGLRQVDLQQEIGSTSLVSLILNGKRQLTVAHMRALAKRFHVPASVFLAETPGNHGES